MRGGSFESKIQGIIRGLSNKAYTLLGRQYRMLYDIESEKIHDADDDTKKAMQKMLEDLDKKLEEHLQSDLSEKDRNLLSMIQKHVKGKLSQIIENEEDIDFFSRDAWKKRGQEMLKTPEPQPGSSGGYSKKEYIVYNSHRYLVRKEKNKKYILSTGKVIYLSTIKGKYTRL